MPETDPKQVVPLTPLTFHILLSLSSGEKHGYGLMKEIRERTQGHLDPATGTVYLALQRLLDDGIVEDTVAKPGDDTDPRRRLYRLTALGREVVVAESERLAALLGLARRRGLLSEQALISLGAAGSDHG